MLCTRVRSCIHYTLGLSILNDQIRRSRRAMFSLRRRVGLTRPPVDRPLWSRTARSRCRVRSAAQGVRSPVEPFGAVAVGDCPRRVVRAPPDRRVRAQYAPSVFDGHRDAPEPLPRFSVRRSAVQRHFRRSWGRRCGVRRVSESQPDFRVFTDDRDRVELGAGWKRVSQNSGNVYVSAGCCDAAPQA